MALIDLSEVTLDVPTPATAKRARAPRHRPGEHFIMGPIPLDWFQVAARLPGHALHLGMLLWYLAGLTKSGSVRPPLGRFGGLIGCDRTTMGRALASLERARLVRVERGTGRLSVVEILAVAEG